MGIKLQSGFSLLLSFGQILTIAQQPQSLFLITYMDSNIVPTSKHKRFNVVRIQFNGLHVKINHDKRSTRKTYPVQMQFTLIIILRFKTLFCHTYTIHCNFLGSHLG